MRTCDTTDPQFTRRSFLTGASVASTLAIGPFGRASGSQIQAGIDIVRTSGYASSGSGSALYVADPAVNRDHVAANPRTSFVSANGRGFRLSLDQTITPPMFGAVPYANFYGGDADFEAIPNSREALQAFFDFCASRRVESANWGGVYGVHGTHVEALTIGGGLLFNAQGGLNIGETETSFQATDSFEGSLVLAIKPGSNIRYVLVNNARRLTNFGPLAIKGPPRDDLAANPDTQLEHSLRLFDVGVLFQNKAMSQHFTSIDVDRARYAGVLIQNGRNWWDNTYNNHFQNCSFVRCGSGSLAPTSYDRTTFSARVDSGNPAFAAEDFFQRSRVTVDRMQPEWLDEHGTVPNFNALPLFVEVGGQLHGVESFDRATKKLVVYPWLPIGMNSGELRYVYGGGMVIKGGDTGITTGKMTAFDCASALLAASNYHGHWTLTAQNCRIGLTLGRYRDDGGVGGSTHCYFEGNTFDIFYNSAGFYPGHKIESVHNLDLRKIVSFTPRGLDNALRPWVNKGLHMRVGATTLRFENERDINGGWFGADISFDQPNSNIIPLHGDVVSIGAVLPADTLMMDRYGYRARTIQVTGNGPNRQPAKVIISPANGKKVNGGAAGAPLQLTGFTAPVTMQLSLDPADPLNNCLVAVGTGYVARAAAQADSAAADVPGLVRDFNALLAKLRSAGLITP